jgi:hypothetical protein
MAQYAPLPEILREEILVIRTPAMKKRLANMRSMKYE